VTRLSLVKLSNQRSILLELSKTIRKVKFKRYSKTERRYQGQIGSGLTCTAYGRRVKRSKADRGDTDDIYTIFN